MVAVDLGAESCRVSLLRWVEGRPVIRLVHRFANAPRETAAGLCWDLAMIVAGLEDGVRQCAALAEEGIRSIAVDGWAVDYVRLDADGVPLGDPFCYRDERTVEAERLAHPRMQCGADERADWCATAADQYGVSVVRGRLQGLPVGRQWMNLPEYVLSRWGGNRVAEYTNATHTQLVDLDKREWCGEIFSALGLALDQAPKLVLPGTVVGRLVGPLAELRALRDTVLIAPACHDTASAIAGIPAAGDDWAYISSGTWSLVGTLLDEPRNDAATAAENFTNLGAVGGKICFHKNVNGMWLIRQCIDAWSEAGRLWTVPELVEAAEKSWKA